MFSLKYWLSEDDADIIDNLETFWEEPGLVRRDEIYLTLDLAALISRNLAKSIYIYLKNCC